MFIKNKIVLCSFLSCALFVLPILITLIGINAHEDNNQQVPQSHHSFIQKYRKFTQQFEYDSSEDEEGEDKGNDTILSDRQSSLKGTIFEKSVGEALNRFIS